MARLGGRPTALRVAMTLRRPTADPAGDHTARQLDQSQSYSTDDHPGTLSVHQVVVLLEATLSKDRLLDLFVGLAGHVCTAGVEAGVAAAPHGHTGVQADWLDPALREVGVVEDSAALELMLGAIQGGSQLLILATKLVEDLGHAVREALAQVLLLERAVHHHAYLCQQQQQHYRRVRIEQTLVLLQRSKAAEEADERDDDAEDEDNDGDGECALLQQGGELVTVVDHQGSQGYHGCPQTKNYKVQDEQEKLRKTTHYEIKELGTR